VLGSLFAQPIVASAHDLPYTWSQGHTLNNGWTGDIVAAWQAILFTEGFLTDCGSNGMDGVYGPHTKAATRQWQQRYHVLPYDGIAGPKTWGRAQQNLEYWYSDSSFDYYNYVANFRVNPIWYFRTNGASWQVFMYTRGCSQWIGTSHPGRSFTPC